MAEWLFRKSATHRDDKVAILAKPRLWRGWGRAAQKERCKVADLDSDGTRGVSVDQQNGTFYDRVAQIRDRLGQVALRQPGGPSEDLLAVYRELDQLLAEFAKRAEMFAGDLRGFVDTDRFAQGYWRGTIQGPGHPAEREFTLLLSVVLDPLAWLPSQVGEGVRKKLTKVQIRIGEKALRRSRIPEILKQGISETLAHLRGELSQEEIERRSEEPLPPYLQ